MTHRTVIAAVNDYSTQNSLPAGWTVPNLGKCIADATAMNQLLSASFGGQNVACLLDAAASREGILDALRTMLGQAQAGDVATFVFAGHGARFPADASNPGRYYECIIPASGAPITDLDLYTLAQALQPDFVNFTLILDSCFSGGIHEDTPDSPIRSSRYGSDYLAACINDMNTIIPCGVLVGISDAFDNNISNVVGQGNGIVCSVDDNKSLVASSKSTVVAACRYDETDAELSDHGALTRAIIDTVNASGSQMTYLELVDSLRSDMQNTLNLSQTPTLLGQQNRMGEGFLAGWVQSKPGTLDQGQGGSSAGSGSTDSVSAGTGLTDTGSGDPGAMGTGSADAGSSGTGSTDSGGSDPGSDSGSAAPE
jgi:hypothetical protein